MKLWDQVGRGQSVASPCFIHSALYLSPPHPVHSRLPHPCFSLSATDRKSKTSSYPCPSCFAFPFFFIKLLKPQSAARKRSGQLPPFQLAGPASRPSCSRYPARRRHVPPAARLFSTVSRLQVRSLRSDWSHRRTKAENELSCFITFIDE